MRINIENIGLIRQGSVFIDNVTVIAGVNDSGKSTIGKVLYSTIKAGLNYERDYNDYIIERLVRYSKSCYRQMRVYIERSSDEDTISEMSPTLFERRLKSSSFSIEKMCDVAKSYVYEVERISSYMDTSASFSRNISRMHELIDSIYYRTSKDDLIGLTLMRNLTSEFNNDISTRYVKSPSIIELSEGRTEILSCKFLKNKIVNVRMRDETMFEDVTYIESPLILNNIKNFSNMSGRNRDLVEKLTRSDSRYNGWYDENKILKYAGEMEIRDRFELESMKLFNVIDGKLEYSIDDEKFYYKKNARTKFDIDNVASGVKSFAMMGLLMSNNILTEDSLLILDEPEVHLHPKWQIEYGRIICELANRGIKVVVSTHSPYMIQAINFFSNRILKGKVNYYLMDKYDDIYTRIEDCTYDLNRIYKLLSEPIEALVWGDYNA